MASLSALKDELKVQPADADVSKLLDLIDLHVESEQLSREVFVSSKIGGLVKKVSETSAHAPCRDKAQKLMAKWKTQFASSSAPSSTAKKQKPASQDEQKKQLAVLTSPRAELPTDAKRVRTVKLLTDIFASDLANFSYEVVEKRCVELEQVLFGLDASVFAAKYRLFKTQLPKNAELRHFLLEGAIESESLLAMSPEEMMPELERQASEKSLHNYSEAKRSDWADANREQILNNAGVKNTAGFFKCGRCQSNKTSFYQKQTRGADEPMTVFVQCLNCKNRWKTEG